MRVETSNPSKPILTCCYYSLHPLIQGPFVLYSETNINQVLPVINLPSMWRLQMWVCDPHGYAPSMLDSIIFETSIDAQNTRFIKYLLSKYLNKKFFKL
jgi:hypothetical protein